MHEQHKLGCTTNAATATTPPVHGDKVIGKLYNKNMVLIPIAIDPFARFGPMFQSFLTHPLNHALKNHGLPPTTTINSTAPMPTSCMSKPPNRPAH